MAIQVYSRLHRNLRNPKKQQLSSVLQILIRRILIRFDRVPLTPPPSSTLPSPTTSPALNPSLTIISVWGGR
jgi:hypothetical protein